ncbi:hypothetical protein [Peijinzhouia sedimentorum]
MSLSFSLQRRPKITLFQSEPGQGPPGLSAYQIWLLQGNSGTQAEFLESLVGDQGLSAYEVWLSDGNEGTIADYLQSLKGEEGQSAYQVWLAAGNEGTEQDFLDSLVGEDGKSAYQVWLADGNEGTVNEFFDSLQGDEGLSAYEVWLAAGNEGTLTDYLNSLQGEQGPAGEQQAEERTGTAIAFDIQAVYNDADAPGSGALTVDMTNSKRIVQKMYLTGAKTWPANWFFVGYEEYDPAKTNIVFAEKCKGTRVEYWVKVL